MRASRSLLCLFGIIGGFCGCPSPTVRGEAAPAADAGPGTGEVVLPSSGLALVSPPAEAKNVPVNLKLLVLAGADDPGMVTLRSLPAGVAIPIEAVTLADECQVAWCGRYRVVQTLAAATSYEVVAGGQRWRFDSAAVSDDTPPEVENITLGYDGACVVVSAEVSEPVFVELSSGGHRLGKTGAPTQRPEVYARAMAAPVAVKLRDLAGNETEKELPFERPAGPQLAITEVMANPVGPEPAQEWVEIRNGDMGAVNLGGLAIRARGSSDDLPAVDVAPGGYALVVGSNYRSEGIEDALPDRGAVIVRLAGATIGAGLRNGVGNLIELVDKNGALLSRYSGYVDAAMHAGASAVRVDEAGCDERRNWREEMRPSPGRAQ